MTDNDGLTDTATVTVTVGAGGAEIIIDNLDPNTSQTGTWKKSSGKDPYLSNSVYNNGGNTFRFIPEGLNSGMYAVSAYWTIHNNRSTTVPYRIRASGITTTVIVNQKEKGGMFNPLGTYMFNGLGDEWVEVSSENGQASADAVQWVSQ